MGKQARHAAIRERAAEAIRNLYHNATPNLYELDTHGLGDDVAQSWFDDVAQFEIEYINDGGYARSESAYENILKADCNAKRYASRAAQRFYVERGMRQMRAERSSYARWERINEYGKIYQWGRGGRTLAPDHLVKMRGGSNFSLREDYCEEMHLKDVVRLIQTVEAFNDYVTRWNRLDNLQTMFDESNLADTEEASGAMEFAD
ncbi:MAG: hypothetical protein KGL39_05055 [Patescibacteria group bacterium]|nr:hypothetical protein [Patescibacteria group bacterium]